jgi:hypothetical protein
VGGWPKAGLPGRQEEGGRGRLEHTSSSSRRKLVDQTRESTMKRASRLCASTQPFGSLAIRGPRTTSVGPMALRPTLADGLPLSRLKRQPDHFAGEHRSSARLASHYHLNNTVDQEFSPGKRPGPFFLGKSFLPKRPGFAGAPARPASRRLPRLRSRARRSPSGGRLPFG